MADKMADESEISDYFKNRESKGAGSSLMSFRKIKRHPVGYVSYSIFKVSDVMREIQNRK